MQRSPAQISQGVDGRRWRAASILSDDRSPIANHRLREGKSLVTMPSHLRLVKPAPASQRELTEANLAAFLHALADLSGRFGIGISTDGYLYEMTADDALSGYRADAESRLIRS